MITTFLALAALAGTQASAAKPSLTWYSDYGRALAAAAAEGKPMAVFLGQGGERLQRMMEDGTVPAEAVQLLRDRYVVVKMENSDAAGRDLATRYGMTEGLIINDSRGYVRALRIGRAVSGDGLTRDLARYAGATATSAGRASAASTASAPTGSSPITPTSVTSSVYAPTAGCPNGRCANGPAARSYAVPTQTTAPAAASPTTAPTSTMTGSRIYPAGRGYTLSSPTYRYVLPAGGCPNGRCPNQR